MRFEGLGYLGFNAGFPRGDGEAETFEEGRAPRKVTWGCKCGIRNLDATVDGWLHLLVNSRMKSRGGLHFRLRLA
jgi:hypothetical protein